MDQAETLRKLMRERAGGGAPVTVFSGPGAPGLVAALAATAACSGNRALAVRASDRRADLMLPAGAGGAQAVRLSERFEAPLVDALARGAGACLSNMPGASGAALPSAALVACGDDLSFHWPVYRSVVILTPAGGAAVECVDTLARLRKERGVNAAGVLVNGCDSHRAESEFRKLKEIAAREIDVELALFGAVSSLEKIAVEVPNRKFLLDLDPGAFSRFPIHALRSLAERLLDGEKA